MDYLWSFAIYVRMTNKQSQNSKLKFDLVNAMLVHVPFDGLKIVRRYIMTYSKMDQSIL